MKKAIQRYKRRCNACNAKKSQERKTFSKGAVRRIYYVGGKPPTLLAF